MKSQSADRHVELWSEIVVTLRMNTSFNKLVERRSKSGLNFPALMSSRPDILMEVMSSSWRM